MVLATAVGRTHCIGALMNIILFSIPLFFLLIFIELWAEKVKNTNYYRVNDSLTSLATGVINQLVSVCQKLIPFTLYVFVEQYFGIFELGDSWLVWAFAFIAYDFFYYWNHRLGHEVNLLWAAHVVHHSSEEYNLTTALRQTGTSMLSVFFYLPLAILGLDPTILLTVGALNLVYQFWVHTRHVGKLGWFEWFFVSPSNHRAHHAQNEIYIDKNYGGVFIIWDRLFGTYQEELDSDPVIFGITGAVKSWNPIWINAQVYASLCRDAWHTKRWQDKVAIWFRRTGWRPEDVSEQFPLEKVDLSTFKKFDIPLPWQLKVYSMIQYAMIAVIVVYFSVAAAETSLQGNSTLVVYAVAGLFGIGAVMSGTHFAGVYEAIRLGLTVCLFAYLPDALIGMCVVLVLICVPFLFFGRHQHDKLLATSAIGQAS